MHGLLGCTINAGVHAGGADVSLRNVTIAQMGNGARECRWRHAPEARGGFGGFWKSQFIELRTRHRTRRVDFWGSQRPDEFARYGRRTICGGGADGKAIIERLCISLPYVETFNSKVIKGFVPELRSRYVFFVFRDSYVLCIYVMNILCTFHISGYLAIVHEYLKPFNCVSIFCSCILCKNDLYKIGSGGEASLLNLLRYTVTLSLPLLWGTLWPTLVFGCYWWVK